MFLNGKRQQPFSMTIGQVHVEPSPSHFVFSCFVPIDHNTACTYLERGRGCCLFWQTSGLGRWCSVSNNYSNAGGQDGVVLFNIYAQQLVHVLLLILPQLIPLRSRSVLSTSIPYKVSNQIVLVTCFVNNRCRLTVKCLFTGPSQQRREKENRELIEK